jgi:hypothetical protein
LCNPGDVVVIDFPGVSGIKRRRDWQGVCAYVRVALAPLVASESPSVQTP